MNAKKTAVIDDFDEFTTWLATTPFIAWGSQKVSGQWHGLETPTPQETSPKPDADLLAALKSMA